MEADLQTHVTFFLTGKKRNRDLDAIDSLDLRPALFAGYRDLTKLRYDFPVVLAEGRSDAGSVQALSALVDGVLAQIATGDDGDKIRKHVIRLEQDIRTLVARGAKGTLGALWDKAAAPQASADKSVAESLARARAALKTDGELVDCDEALPKRLIGHAWGAVQRRKAQRFGEQLTRISLKLADILKADYVNSDAGKSPENLKASIGTMYSDAFDFDAMSSILKKAMPKVALPEARRKRINGLIATLNSQRFFPAPAVGAKRDKSKPYAFAFDSFADALEAYRERLPKAVELAKAIAIAELEMKGEYNEARHDAIFDAFGENGLSASDLAAFPDYLVSINARELQAAENDRLIEILSAGLPMKILVQTDDILEESALGNGHLAFGLRAKQLASMAIGLSEVFVLQSPASNLVRFRDRLLAGLTHGGAALFSVYSGASGRSSVLPAYLASAAAMESRVFPAFAYDPSAGPDWASRFSLADNPQAELDWPVQGFTYEDQNFQRVSENVEFTLLEFAASDRRYAKHFARVPRAKWNGSLIPAAESLKREIEGLPEKVPCLLMIDKDDTLQKVIVDQKLVREARRCREMWRSLQELGGIHNSHAERLLAREKKAWEEQAEREAASRVAAASPAAAPAVAAPAAAPAPAAAAAPAAAPAAEAPAEKSGDDAYIETPRCSTCNECITLNGKMFAYDGNKQAYIADINAGTYAQLVEAAENCQVSIIHPGKPRNPKEPGLEELLKRAAPFL